MLISMVTRLNDSLGNQLIRTLIRWPTTPSEIEFKVKTGGTVAVTSTSKVNRWTRPRTGDDATTGKVIEDDKCRRLQTGRSANYKEGDVIIHLRRRKGKNQKPRQDTPNSYDTYNTTEERWKPKTRLSERHKIVPVTAMSKLTAWTRESSDQLKQIDKTTLNHLTSTKEVKVTFVPKDMKANTSKLQWVDEKNQPVDKDYDTVMNVKEIPACGKTYELVAN